MTKVTDKEDKQCHEMLPIDPDEKVLAIYRHHVFAYVIPIAIAVIVITVLLGLTVMLSSQTSFSGDAIIPLEYQRYAYGTAIVLSMATLVFTFIPVWLRLQEHIVLTDEAVLQVLQPALFASKVSQTSLEHIADVSVRQDFLGTVLGYGKLTLETPGEQDNYDYYYLPRPREAAREIIEAHENFAAALQSGRLPTTLGSQPLPMAAPGTIQQGISIDAEQYQAFLRFQQQDKQQQASQPPQDGPTNPVG